MKIIQPAPKPFYQSRKCFYAFCAISLIAVSYLMTIYLVTIYPFASVAYLSLFGTMVTFITGITAGVCGLHQWMDLASQK